MNRFIKGSFRKACNRVGIKFKNRTNEKHLAQVVVTLLLRCSSLLAQNANNNSLISTNGSFIILLNQKARTEIVPQHQFDIALFDFYLVNELE